MNKLQVFYFIGRLGLVLSIVSMFFFAAMGLLLFEIFSTPWDASYISAFPSLFVSLNAQMSSISYLRFITSAAVIDFFEASWLITIVYAMLHLFGASYTLMFKTGLWIVRGRPAQNPLKEFAS